MSFALELNPTLRSPAYWQGIDIARPFQSEMTEPHWEYMPVKTMQHAGAMLLGALRDVVRGEYAETEIPPGNKGSATTALYPDGTVIVLDRERLERYEYRDEYRPWSQSPSRSAPIEEPFVSHWLQNQLPRLDSDASDVHFGSEEAVFPDHHRYSRGLSWGVLLSSQEQEGRRLVPTWPLDHPRLTHEGLSMGVAREACFCITQDVPIHDRSARLGPPLSFGPIRRKRGFKKSQPHPADSGLTVYMAERIRSARIIYTASGPLPAVPDIDELADGRLTLSLV